MKKNSTFNNGVYTLLTTSLTIEYKDKVITDDDDHWVYGITITDRGGAIIQISTKDEDGDPLPKEQIEATLRHELFHFILDTLYFKEESTNETLVEWLASATHLLNKQGLNI